MLRSRDEKIFWPCWMFANKVSIAGKGQSSVVSVSTWFNELLKSLQTRNLPFFFRTAIKGELKPWLFGQGSMTPSRAI